ncbi:MAG: transposase [Cytophagales bacterium]|nr:transposase [Cytophagales bacterium]MCZ8068786.1 transposase [Cytophagales bacterium]
MYVRRKKNKSGKISVQIIDKSSGSYKVRQTIGSSANEQEIGLLQQQGELYIKNVNRQTEINFILGDDATYFQSIYNNIQQVQLLGPELVLGQIFDSNNKGYNKYLKLQGQVTITLDEEKYLADSKWDGLKGYLTNTTLAKEAVVEYYRQLWHVEKTFRISKTDLRIRPVYHFKRKRIETHICIAFAACKVYKELERQLRNRKSDLSPEKAIEILKTIYGITIQLPQSKENKLMLLDKTKEQKALLNMFI